MLYVCCGCTVANNVRQQMIRMQQNVFRFINKYSLTEQSALCTVEQSAIGLSNKQGGMKRRERKKYVYTNDITDWTIKQMRKSLENKLVDEFEWDKCNERLCWLLSYFVYCMYVYYLSFPYLLDIYIYFRGINKSSCCCVCVCIVHFSCTLFISNNSGVAHISLSYYAVLFWMHFWCSDTGMHQSMTAANVLRSQIVRCLPFLCVVNVEREQAQAKNPLNNIIVVLFDNWHIQLMNACVQSFLWHILPSFLLAREK